MKCHYVIRRAESKCHSNNTTVDQEGEGDYLHMQPEQNLLQITLPILLLHIFIVAINFNKKNQRKTHEPLKRQLGKSFPIIGYL